MCIPGTRLVENASQPPPPKTSNESSLARLVAEVRESLVQGRRRRASPQKHAVSLTHTYRAGFPVSIYDPPSCFPLLRRDVEGYYSQGWTIQEHSGTHIDMPAHFYPDGRTAPELRPDELMLSAAVIDIRARTASEPDCVLTLDDIVLYERKHGRIPPRAAVLMAPAGRRGSAMRASSQTRMRRARLRSLASTRTLCNFWSASVTSPALASTR